MCRGMSILSFSPEPKSLVKIPRLTAPPNANAMQKRFKMVQTQIPGFQPGRQDQVETRKLKSNRGIVTVCLIIHVDKMVVVM
jgi:hypothetical protein